MERRTVHVAVYDTFADWEPAYATTALAGAGHHVVYVGESGEPVISMGGMRVTPHLSIADLRPGDSALLILPGADAWEQVLPPFAGAARRFLDAGVPVAAICGAVTGLAKEGLLDDRDHTGAAAEVLAATGYRGGARYREADAYTDGDLITAGPTEPVAFAREILTRLAAHPAEVTDAWFRLFRHSDAAAYEVLTAYENGGAGGAGEDGGAAAVRGAHGAHPGGGAA
ncbi:DJ-1/PfpI family protein [Streptomyces sp. TRM 70361]|uniref:DJ-1/PfpI family protein n=1 Tax=Streptomyces sp. TRM 70361 TaxID=3116553 RepID=UPI002E7C2DD7|nr:DJ-1/PfpI family protein [Streptomyces sp. TRM 70361]MEE1941730.1 DJ-1/PfpI family protein [Streptomyces sp. TRM 70361]